MKLIEHAYAIARRQLEENWNEVSGPKSNPKILEVYKAVDGLDNMELNDDEIPWCSCFANWCIQKAGGKGTRSAMARSWLSWGEKSDGQVGDIVVLKRGTSNVQGHVGFVVKKGLLNVEVVGGNQSNNVTVQSFSRTKVLGYRTSKDINGQSSPQKIGVNMDLVVLLNSLVANIAALQAQLVDAQASADALAKAKYDEGFAAGVASVGGGEKIYSQAELDAKIAEAVAPLNVKIAELDAKVAELSAALVAEAGKLVAFKADLLAKYEAQQVAESEGETGFKNLLV